MALNFGPADFKLLVIFDAIIRERSVTLASRRLGMSQPATSNALNRLRSVLKDPLFTRTETGMTPTARALDLAGPIAEGLGRIESALNFGCLLPTEDGRVFNLAMSNQAQIVVLPLLLQLLKQVAPRTRLKILPKWNETIEEQLDSGAIDFAVGIIPNLAKRFQTITLFEDEYVCLMGNQHPFGGRNITTDEFLASEHIVVRPFLERTSQIDQTLRQLGAPRHAVLNVSQFSVVPVILRQTELIASLLRTVALQIKTDYCQIYQMPFKNEPMKIIAAWNAGRMHDVENKWMRTQLYQSCASLREI